jgi:hypothetical protein
MQEGRHFHYMSNGWVNPAGAGGAVSYPTTAPAAAPAAAFADDAVSRRCLMCHVDHDYFRRDLNEAKAAAARTCARASRRRR